MQTEEIKDPKPPDAGSVANGDDQDILSQASDILNLQRQKSDKDVLKAFSKTERKPRDRGQSFQLALPGLRPPFGQQNAQGGDMSHFLSLVKEAITGNSVNSSQAQSNQAQILTILNLYNRMKSGGSTSRDLSGFPGAGGSSGFGAPYKQYNANLLSSMLNQFNPSPTANNQNFREQFAPNRHLPGSPHSPSTAQQLDIQKAIEMLQGELQQLKSRDKHRTQFQEYGASMNLNFARQ